MPIIVRPSRDLPATPRIRAVVALAIATGMDASQAEALQQRLLAYGFAVAPCDPGPELFMVGGNVNASDRAPGARHVRIGDHAARDAWRMMMAELLDRQERCHD